jgi:hypothetical protein
MPTAKDDNPRCPGDPGGAQNGLVAAFENARDLITGNPEPKKKKNHGTGRCENTPGSPVALKPLNDAPSCEQ